MIRRILSRARVFFWRTIHLLVNSIAFRLVPDELGKMPSKSRLWRLNDYVASKYIPPLTQEQQNTLFESLASVIGAGVQYDEHGSAVAFIDVLEVEEDTFDRVTLPDVEDVTDKLPVATQADKTAN